MELLEKLMLEQGVSGNEAKVRDLIAKEIKPYVSELFTDNMGNLIAHSHGKSPRVMLAAHMDEVGLMVKKIDENGKIFFTTIGYMEPAALIGQRVSIPSREGKINGVIITKEMSEEKEIKKLPNMGEMFIDSGMEKEELEKAGVEAGTYINPVQPVFWLGKHRVSGKALDDRVGCYILIELAKRLKKKTKNQIFYVFTTQEEVGLYGAKTSAYSIEPDWAITVDVTNYEEGSEGSPRDLGKGPTITVKDSEMLANRCINGWIKEIAKKKKIPIQMDVSDAGTTDALSISITRSGIPSGVIGVTVKNLHSMVGIAHKKDIVQVIEILEELLKNPPKVCLV